jgi:hypothetical protein
MFLVQSLHLLASSIYFQQGNIEVSIFVRNKTKHRNFYVRNGTL